MEEFKKIKVIHGPDIELIVDNPTSLEMVGKGAHGAVFKLSRDTCVKIYADEHNAALEADAYNRTKESNIIPKLISYGRNYVVMELVEGDSFWRHLHRNAGITLEQSKQLVNLVNEMKRIGFTRLDASLRHIIVDKNGDLKVVDLVYAYTRHDETPIKILSDLDRMGLRTTFLAHVKGIDYTKYLEWQEVQVRK